MNLNNSYESLPALFFQRSQPTPTTEPQLVLWNDSLAGELGLGHIQDDAERARLFSGSAPLGTTEPVALAYAGHQFGHFVPSLGDGRAHLLGEVGEAEGRRDIQLKGSGTSPFSRGGDGRCALGPAVREFVMSEAMHTLGVPTSRCLAVVATGEPVFRETALPGAVVSRVAQSHLRVGTFQYAAARREITALRELANYAIDRHFPEIREQKENRYAALLDRVIERQVELIVQWTRVGFIHGVMNTDNTAVSGETIDFGPCAMMNHYDPKTVFSSIDELGRYAFGNQAAIATWNMSRLAQALLPLISNDAEVGSRVLLPHVEAMAARFHVAELAMYRGKLGLSLEHTGDEQLISSLLDTLQALELDYTNTFVRLGRRLDSTQTIDPTLKNAPFDPALERWFQRWQQRLTLEPDGLALARARMSRSNPVVIPRNHHVEAALSAANGGDLAPVRSLLSVLRNPYRQLPETHQYQEPPADGDQHYQTFCGT